MQRLFVDGIALHQNPRRPPGLVCRASATPAPGSREGPLPAQLRASKATVCYVRNTSAPAVRCALNSGHCLTAWRAGQIDPNRHSGPTLWTLRPRKTTAPAGIGDSVLALLMLMIILYRPKGIAGGREISFPLRRRSPARRNDIVAPEPSPDHERE